MHASQAAEVCEKAFSHELADESCAPAAPYSAWTAALKLSAAPEVAITDSQARYDDFDRFCKLYW
jgi:hypothetical protein